MKRKTLNAEFFEQNFPPASEAYERQTMDALRSIASQKEEKPMRSKRMTAILVMCMVLILLAATALAITLGGRSARYRAIDAAREAIMDKYSVTTDMLGILTSEVTSANDAWVVVFRGEMFNAEAIGDYTAVIRDDEEPIVTWTHDDIDPAVWSSGSLDAPVWGPQQVETALSFHREYYAKMGESEPKKDENGNIRSWTLEEQAEFDQMLADASEQGMPVSVLRVAPEEGDISEADAIERAKEAIVHKYGVDIESLAQYETQISFYKYASEDEKQYRVNFGTSYKLDDPGVWAMDVAYSVALYSPSGTVQHCVWNGDKEDRPLPDGPLVDYEEAVKEFVEEGSFALLTPERKADVSQRIIDAGYGAYIDNRQYVAPTSEDISQEDSIISAGNAMRETYGFVDDTLTLFSVGAALLYEDGVRVWHIIYTPDLDDWCWMLVEPMGTYEACVAANSGDVTSVTWSLADAHVDEPYTERTWGTADAYDGRMLPWVAALIDKVTLIVERNDEDFWMLEEPMQEIAAFDQVFRDAGFDREIYYHGVPDEHCIPEQQALKNAKKAVCEQFQVSNIRLDNATVITWFSVADPDQPQWSFSIRMNDDGRQDDYGVLLDAQTGEVIHIGYISAGNG